MMTQTSQTGSPELSYNSAALLPTWQRGNTSLFANDPQTKKRKLEAIKINVNKSRTKPPASQVFFSYLFIEIHNLSNLGIW